MPPFDRRFLGLPTATGSIAALLLCFVTGCGVGQVLPVASPDVHIGSVRPPPDGVTLPTGARTAAFAADPKRLHDDIDRAAEKSEWAILHIYLHGSFDGQGDNPNAAGAAWVEARAMTPDNRTAVVFAWAVDAKHVAVAVRIGHFGDEPIERAYIHRLANVMAGKPRPKRGGNFELP